MIPTQHGPAIGIFHQYAYTGKGKTIHSSGQLEWYKNNVNERSIKVPGGLQQVQTVDGYVIPINVKAGLPYIKTHPYTDKEWDTLPHVVLTSDKDWDPSVLDHTLDDNEDWYNAVSDLQIDPATNLFDEFGNYHNCTVVQEVFFDSAQEPAMISELIDECVLLNHCTSLYEAQEHVLTTKKPDYEALHPNFGQLLTDIIKYMFAATTQYDAHITMSTVLKKHY